VFLTLHGAPLPAPEHHLCPLPVVSYGRNTDSAISRCFVSCIRGPFVADCDLSEKSWPWLGQKRALVEIGQHCHKEQKSIPLAGANAIRDPGDGEMQIVPRPLAIGSSFIVTWRAQPQFCIRCWLV
jgi:hypothetical protein